MKLTEHLAIREGKSSCLICGGVGFTLEHNIPGSKSSVLSICNCTSTECLKCESKGRPPYLAYDKAIEKMIPCFCHKVRIELNRLEELMQKSNIPARYRYKFLSDIDLSDKNNLTLFAAHDWANSLILHLNDFEYWEKNNQEKKGMYLWGGTGSGKTLLACVILNELIFRYGVECRYVKINMDFLDALKDTYQRDSEFHGKERSILLDFTQVEVLVLDDFGVQKDTEWALSKLYDLIDARYEEEKLTLLTSNSSISDWKEKGFGRIYSRLYEMTRELHLDCQDYRLRFQYEPG
ncbi:MAG: ATP-binding protein [Leptospiraceae bacterium]|nr:ATP-binding protein [Leptospiraceae bacterium]MCK6382034.1 ATP-binding protein [Leptospiraceae bacterium]NUM40799.1 ATP-binding protein [Leptospiraceae bacterium]